MNSRSIKLASMVGISTMLIILLGIGIYGIDQLNKLNEVRTSLKRTNEVMNNLQGIFTLLKDAETGQRGFLITGDERYLAPYRNASARINEFINPLRTLTRDSANQSRDINTLEKAIQNKFSELEETIVLRRTKGYDAAREVVLTDRGKDQMDRIRHTFAKMYEREYDLLNQRQQEQGSRTKYTFLWLIGLCVVSIVFQITMGLITLNFLERERLSTAKLREQAELLNLSHDAVFVRDLDGTIRYWNRGAQTMYGFGQTEALGQVSHTLLRTEFPSSAEATHNHLLKNGYWEEELIHHTSDDRKIVVSSRQTVKLDGQGVPSGVLEINTDITAQKEAEQKQAALNELKRVNTELEQFTSMVSHDLQEPLRAIAGSLQILDKSHKDKLDKDAAELMRHAVDGALRMRTLINDLLSLCRVQGTEATLMRVDLTEVLQEAEKNIELSIKENHVTIRHDTLPVIKAEKTLLVQLLQNLLSNAIKFCKDKSPDIHISVQKNQNYWQICVRDNGIGFDNQYADRIFQPFKRLHGRDTYAGNGIGLAICKSIVEKHGGTIWATSELGHGATFCFTLFDFD